MISPQPAAMAPRKQAAGLAGVQGQPQRAFRGGTSSKPFRSIVEDILDGLHMITYPQIMLNKTLFGHF